MILCPACNLPMPDLTGPPGPARPVLCAACLRDRAKVAALAARFPECLADPANRAEVARWYPVAAMERPNAGGARSGDYYQRIGCRSNNSIRRGE